MSEKTLMQFQQLRLRISPSFWAELSRRKLDTYQLSDSAVEIAGVYHAGAPFLELESGSFDVEGMKKVFGSCSKSVALGRLHLYNTAEDFKKSDKKALLSTYANDISKQGIDKYPCRFLLVAYADLKRHVFTYLSAVVALRYKSADVLQEGAAVPVKKEEIPKEVCEFSDGDCGESFRILSEIPTGFNHSVVLRDPADEVSHPGWPLRNICADLIKSNKTKSDEKVSVYCVRSGGRVIRFNAVLPCLKDSEETPVGLGWEVTNGSVKAKTVSLAEDMDPVKLAESAVDLNLRLMRWRMFPELDLDKISKTRCLLLGAGTLGCHVSRALLGWGVRHITFVDCGRVSYSNPVRQSLYTFSDCANGGRFKAEAAAERLKEIFPSVEAKGVILTIPMPGHFVGPADEERVKADCDKLEELVKSHDAIFLLGDSRECRWLPTLLGAVYKKLVITVGVGFDTYVVVRHGVPPDCNLGCYFCSDVVAPRDSLTDRTLDQACTVTRPGVAMLASASAAELLIAVLHHPKGAEAPAGSEGALGPVPHQLRGFLGEWQENVLTGDSFCNCVACSKAVREAFETRKFEFLKEVFNNPVYLEEVSGVAMLRAEMSKRCGEETTDQCPWESVGGDGDDF